MNSLILDSSIKYLNTITSMKMMSSLNFHITKVMFLNHDIDSKFKRSIGKYDSEVAILLYYEIRNNETKLAVVQNIYNYLVNFRTTNRLEKRTQVATILPVFGLLIKDNIERYIFWKHLLSIMCFYGFTDIVKILVNAGSPVPQDRSLEGVAKIFGYDSLARYLAKVNSLYYSTSANDIIRTKIILHQNIKIDIDKALIAACKANNIEIVKLLLDYGADVSQINEKPLRVAMKHKNKELIKLLVEHGASRTKACIIGLIC